MMDATMTTFAFERYGMLAMALLVTGCLQRPAKPAPPPPAPVQVVAPVEQPGPLAPKCERLDEGCVAVQGIKVRIKQSGYAFDPPVGWVFAHEEALGIASTTGGAIAATAHVLDNPKKEAPSRLLALDLLMARMEVTPPKKKLTWPKKPADILDVGDLKISLWQVEKATRKDVKGDLLVFWATPSEGQGITGVGFVASDDKTGADEAILKSIKTMGKFQ
jgi:hypothetical protein